ncbi:hypothetical protein JKF63_00559 [Porcisia hertigi]|uniref:Thioredoxin-like fold domain-containing protein n=1 Tax=Porcisia hertigi TaxID=2761500 RepID=A0A836HDB8_9TRYP|nr:hypothetical protein JKF63_00559 [Porcisia hertigi]
MNYFGQWPNLELVRQDGSRRLAADVLCGVPYVVLFFGASWCSECEAFMDVMENFYEAYHEAKGFEVVYISRDYSRAEMMKSFLLSERAAAAAEKSEHRQRTQEGSHRCLNPGCGQEGEAGLSAEEGPKEGANHELCSVHDASHSSEHRKYVSRANSSFTTPPPLKRVAELSVNTTVTSGLASSLANPLMSCGPHGFWAVPYDHVGCVGVPILYHLRVFTYPGVVVCRNKSFSADLKPVLLPSLPVVHQAPVEHCTAVLQDNRSPEGSQTELTQQPLLPSIARANAPQRRQKTPMLARRELYPDVITIAGRFMVEQDPCGENFPWDRMDSKTRCSALIFLVIVGVLAVIVVSWALPLLLVAQQGTSLKALTKL